MKKLLTLLLCGLSTAWAYAATAIVDGIEWSYRIEDGKAIIENEVNFDLPAIDSETSGEITIPSKLGGKDVTSIGYRAFAACSQLTKVTIPEGVKRIEYYAFMECTSLESVIIPSTVTTMMNGAFMGCTALYKDASGVQYESANKVVLIKVPTTQTGAFEVPEGVRFIGSDAFAGCTGITSVKIPESVISVHAAFSSVGSDIAFYTDDEGVRYESEDKVVLISVPSTLTGEFTIPESVRFIEWGAFSWVRYEGACTQLTAVTIPEGVEEIGYGAFRGCTGLTAITIPSSVRIVRDKAFIGCTGLTSVTICEGVGELELDNRGKQPCICKLHKPYLCYDSQKYKGWAWRFPEVYEFN